MQSRLFRASVVSVRSVARSRTFASHRAYRSTRSTGGFFSAIHASRKALAIGGGITSVAASTSLFARSSLSTKEHSVTDEQKSNVRLRLLDWGISLTKDFLPFAIINAILL